MTASRRRRRELLTRSYRAAVRLWVFLGSADEEVSPVVCVRAMGTAATSTMPISVTPYPGATHDFADAALPGRRSPRIARPGKIR